MPERGREDRSLFLLRNCILVKSSENFAIPLDSRRKLTFNRTIFLHFVKENPMKHFNAYAYWWYGFTKP